MSALSFKIEKQDSASAARLGRLTTPHGAVQTPTFVAVGTQATVKAIAPDDLTRLGVQILIANTYHLHLRPGESVIQELGGLHRFMGWPGPIMTDSGGFQIFSLGAGIEHGVGKIGTFPEEGERGGHLRPARQGQSLVRVDEESVSFRSHLDGSHQRFTPEGVIDIQRALGSDIMLVLDECTSPLHDYEYTREALERTHRWAERALARFQETEPQMKRPKAQGLYGIVQGGAFRDLREQSARFISELDFDGIAIGGSLGTSKNEMHEVLDWTIPLLPKEQPRHLLGIGAIPDIFEVVQRGVDTFDCVAPTRLARLGALLVRDEPDYKLTITNARFERDSAPIDSNCDCYACQNFSRAYLHHLFNAKEILAMRLATIHNVHFLSNLMVQIRRAIAEGQLDALKREWLERGS
jgi:queuine tRNA-ribosyltransferase/7-cyano-7-deazaguanine tRNA-ribosyltransferase